jgi:stage II sporulation protein AA (anti-sigma F factor antagonist)
MRDSSHELVLDFTDTGYIDSSATALVASLAVDLRAKRAKLAVVAPPGSPTRRVFEVSGLAGEVDLVAARQQTSAPSS